MLCNNTRIHGWNYSKRLKYCEKLGCVKLTVRNTKVAVYSLVLHDQLDNSLDNTLVFYLYISPPLTLAFLFSSVIIHKDTGEIEKVSVFISISHIIYINQ